MADKSKLRQSVIAVFLLTPIVVLSIAYWGTAESEASLQRRCEQFRLVRNWTEFSKVADRWTKRFPNSADAWLFRAEAAQELREYEILAKALGKVPPADHRALLAWVERVNVLFENLNRPQEAIETCHEILKLDPRVAIVRQRLIFFYALTLQRAAMIREIRAAIEVHREPREAYVYLAGSHWLYFSNLYELNTKWLESDPHSEVYQVARAMHVLNSNAKDNPNRAAEFQHIPDADQLLQMFPRNVEVLAYHLERKMAAGEIDAVQKLLANPPQEANTDARIWLARGWVNDNLGKSEAAELDLKTSLKIDPYGWQTYHYLADHYRRTGQKDLIQHHEKLYQEGKKLRDVITKLQDARSASPEILKQIATYAEESGDSVVAEALRHRLQNE